MRLHSAGKLFRNHPYRTRYSFLCWSFANNQFCILLLSRLDTLRMANRHNIDLPEKESKKYYSGECYCRQKLTTKNRPPAPYRHRDLLVTSVLHIRTHHAFFYSKHHAKLEGKINFLLKSTIRNFISIGDFGLKWEITADPVFSLYPNLCPEYIGTTESCLQQFLIISC